MLAQHYNGQYEQAGGAAGESVWMNARDAWLVAWMAGAAAFGASGA